MENLWEILAVLAKPILYLLIIVLLFFFGILEWYNKSGHKKCADYDLHMEVFKWDNTRRNIIQKNLNKRLLI